MLLTTRKKFNAFTEQVASLNNVSNVVEKFTVVPSVQQTMEERVQNSSEFLKLINFEFPIEQQGEKIGVGIDSTIAGRTDTSTKERDPSDPTALYANSYFCRQTNYDSQIPYSRLDAWAHKKNFQPLIRDSILKRKALDRILIGFNGTYAAKDTDRATYPLLQDVNIGWLQKYRNEAPERVMKEVVPGSGKVIIGKKGDYKNIDALVLDTKDTLIDEVFAESADLVVICNRNTLAEKYFPIVNDADTNTEKVAGKILVSSKTIGGLLTMAVPGFPKGKLFITSLDNLSIYIQLNSSRRAIIDNPKRDRVENFESDNEDFVVEDYRSGCLIENIEFAQDDETETPEE